MPVARRITNGTGKPLMFVDRWIGLDKRVWLGKGLGWVGWMDSLRRACLLGVGVEKHNRPGRWTCLLVSVVTYMYL